MEGSLLCSKSTKKGAFKKKFSESERASHENKYLEMKNPGIMRSTKALKWEYARNIAGVE